MSRVKNLTESIIRGANIRKVISGVAKNQKYNKVRSVKESVDSISSFDDFVDFVESLPVPYDDGDLGVYLPDEHDDGYVESEWNGLYVEFDDFSDYDASFTFKLDGWMSVPYGSSINFLYNSGKPSVVFELEKNGKFLEKKFNSIEDFIAYTTNSYKEDFAKFLKAIEKELDEIHDSEWKNYPNGEGYPENNDED